MIFCKPSKDEPEGNLQVGDRVRALREIRESGRVGVKVGVKLS